MSSYSSKHINNYAGVRFPLIFPKTGCSHPRSRLHLRTWVMRRHRTFTCTCAHTQRFVTRRSSAFAQITNATLHCSPEDAHVRGRIGNRVQADSQHHLIVQNISINAAAWRYGMRVDTVTTTGPVCGQTNLDCHFIFFQQF